MKWNEISKFKEFGIINPTNFGFVSYIDFINEQIEKYIEFILRGGKSGRDFTILAEY